MDQRLSLRLTPEMRLNPFSMNHSLVDLDEEGLEELLDESHLSILEHKQEVGDRTGGGNFLYTKSFRNILKEVKEKNIGKKRPLLLEEEDSKYSIKNYKEFQEGLKEVIERNKNKFSSAKKKNPKECFILELENNINYFMGIKKKVIEYVCNYQKEFIETLNPFDLKSLKQEDVAKKIGGDLSEVNRVLQDATLNIPGIPFEFNIKELIPGNKLDGIQIRYALSEIKQNQDLYKDGSSKISFNQIKNILKEKYNLNFADRTIRKHMTILKGKSNIYDKDSDEKVALYNEIYEQIDYLDKDPSLCSNGEWMLSIKDLTALLKKEINENVDQKILEDIISVKNWCDCKNYKFRDYKV